jgi:hypothetical protein
MRALDRDFPELPPAAQAKLRRIAVNMVVRGMSRSLLKLA